MKASKAESIALMTRILEQGIKPHLDALAPILARGDIAVVFYECHDLKMARRWGWRRDRPAFEMPERLRHLLMRSDQVTRRWLSEEPNPDKGRIFVFVHEGTFLVNFRPDEGYSLEPGSTDQELVDSLPVN